MESPRNKISILPKHLIDQIYAGEVLERPASLLKELIENSLDARSLTIDVNVMNNGLDYLEINDDGCGISLEDLPLAFLKHATSKIKQFNDLYRLTSYGFRGEALSSLASISKVSCSSSTLGSECSSKIVIHGGRQIYHGEGGLQKTGTSLFIKDLFYNTPARLKFIRSSTSEKKALKKVIFTYLLVNIQCSFSFKQDEGVRSFYPRTDDLRERVLKVFFSGHKQEKIYYVEKEYDDHRVIGYFSHFSKKGLSGKHQYLFVNKRPFEERSLHYIIARSLVPLWTEGQLGYYVFFITAPPDLIDVNVHPNKLVVKFNKGPLLHALFGSMLKQKVRHLNVVDQNGTRSYGDNISVNSVNELHCLLSLYDKFHIVQKKSHEIVIFSVSRFISFYLKKTWCKKNVIEEDEMISLMVSEPFTTFTNKFDIHLPFLKQIGLEFDRLNERTLVLRTIPKCLKSLPYREIIRTILTHLSRENTLNKILDLENIFDEIVFSWNNVHSLLPSLQERGDIVDCFSIDLSLNKLAKLFKDEF